MTPNVQGKFCGSCQKNVVDFTHKSAVAIQKYFTENTGKLICGRFEKTQLNTITLQIPQQLLFSQVHFHKMFLLALLIAMGYTLFSCSDSNGTKQKIDKVEVVIENTTEESNITIGMLIPPDPQSTNTDTIFPPQPPALKIEEVRFVKPSKTGEIKVIETKPHELISPEEFMGKVIIVQKDSLNHDDN